MMFQPPRTVFSKHDFQEKYQIKSVLYDGVFDFSGNHKPTVAHKGHETPAIYFGKFEW